VMTGAGARRTNTANTATKHNDEGKKDTMTVRYDDDIILSGGSATAGGGPEDMLPTEGRVLCKIADIKKDKRNNFKTGAEEDCLRVIYEGADTPKNRKKNLVGKTVDERASITRNLANDLATMHKRYKAATGITPQPGGDYPLKSGMVGRYVWIQLGARVSAASGSVWPTVEAVLPLDPDDYEDNGLETPATAEVLYAPAPTAPARTGTTATATRPRVTVAPPDDDEDDDED
jgi:hypothetical protein